MGSISNRGLLTRWLILSRWAKGKMPRKRWKHCLRTSVTAGFIAFICRVSKWESVVAGLLHDVERESASGDCENSLTHGIQAVHTLERELEMTNPCILEAVEYHTFGRAGLGPVAKVVFSADGLEWGRRHPLKVRLRFLRLLFRGDLDEIVLLTIESSEAWLKERGLVLHSDTLSLYDEILRNRGS